MIVGVLTGISQHLMPSKRFAQRLLGLGLGLELGVESGLGLDGDAQLITAASSSSSSSSSRLPPLPSFTLRRVQVMDGTTILDNFVETLPTHSIAYQQLWPTTSTTTTATAMVIDEDGGGCAGSAVVGGGGAGGGEGSTEGRDNNKNPCVRSPHPLVAVDCEMCDTSEGLVLTRLTLVDHASQVRSPHPLVAVDCEMCDTSEGLVLTRLTLVDHAFQVTNITTLKR